MTTKCNETEKSEKNSIVWFWERFKKEQTTPERPSSRPRAMRGKDYIIMLLGEEGEEKSKDKIEVKRMKK